MSRANSTSKGIQNTVRRALFLVARQDDKLKSLASEIRKKFNISIETAELDVSKSAAVNRWKSEKAQLLSQVEVLINSAGLAKGYGPFQNNRTEDWDTMIDTNLKGLLYMTHAIVPYFTQRKAGHIIHLGSIAGRWSYANGNVYCATKSAVAMLTETMRIDLAGTGIRVTNICPGMVKTNFSKVRFEDEQKADAVYKGMTPLTASDIADAVFWAYSRPPHVNIQEIVLYPTEQASASIVSRKTT